MTTLAGKISERLGIAMPGDVFVRTVPFEIEHSGGPLCFYVARGRE